MLFRPLLPPALVSVQRQATQQATVHPILPVRLTQMCESKCQVQGVGIRREGGGCHPMRPIHISAGMFLGEIHIPRATPVSAVRTEFVLLDCTDLSPVLQAVLHDTYLKYYKIKALGTALHDLKKKVKTLESR